MDGIEAAEQIRARFDIPVVYLTAHADTGTLQRAKITGPAGYLLKPFEERELQVAIEIGLYRRQMERRLKESEQWLAATLRSIGDAVIATNVEGQVTFLNPMAEAVTGWKRDEAMGKDVREVFHIVQADTGAPVERLPDTAVREAAVTGWAGHVLLDAAREKRVPIDDNAAPIRDDKGNVIGAVLAFRDVTDRVQAEEEIRRRNRDLALLNRIIAASAASSDRAGILETACRELASALGVHRVDAVLFSQDKATASVVAGYPPTNSSRDPASRVAGEPGAELQRAPAGADTADFTPGRFVRLSSLPTDSRDSASGDIVAVPGNQLFEHLLARQEPLVVEDMRSDPRAMPVRDMLHLQDSVSLLLVPIVSQGNVLGSLSLHASERRLFSPQEVNLVCSVANQVAGALARVRAEEERRNLEEQYYQAQKMEAIGRLTGGIAHDFKNLLTVINGFAELTRRHLPPESAGQRMIDHVLRAGGNAAELVRQLLAFSRRQILNPRSVNLNDVVAGMQPMLSRVIDSSIAIETLLVPDLWRVRVDPTQFELAILNLVVNARDAMPEGGQLTIKTINVMPDELPPAARAGAAPRECVLLSVSDTGTGMSEDVKAQLFEPFYTTKELGRGTGLGLATVLGIVRQSDGEILCDSQEGVGTTFRIYLPRAEDAAPCQPCQQREEAMARGNETLLLVEDDASMRELADEVLRQQGYTVLQAENGQQALAVARAHPGPIHLLLTDMIMPGMSGRALADRLAELRPGIRRLFLSGSDERLAAAQAEDKVASVLQKPFSPLDLVCRVRDVLDAEAVPGDTQG